MSSSVKVIADSISPEGKRITTLEARYWRGIHAELMTHRAFARNAASSRAIPFLSYLPSSNAGGPSMNQLSPKCTVATLMNDPFIPEFIGAEQKGMQAGEELSGGARHAAEEEIKKLCKVALDTCQRLYDLGVHKSIINRYLEPWCYITVVITATEWDNFFKLRCHPAAEKHFQKLANQMQEAMAASAPKLVGHGSWHLPYVQPLELACLDSVDKTFICHHLEKPDDWSKPQILEVLKKVSAARCARVSYLTHDGKRDLTADLALAERLLNPGDGAIHASPFEHVACPTHPVGGVLQPSGPFIGWKQYRKEIPGETFIKE